MLGKPKMIEEVVIMFDSKKHIRWLRQELPVLADNGLLTREVVESLEAYYGVQQQRGGRRIAVVIFAVAGALLIGTGLILLLGHNWEKLTRGFRVMLSLAPLAAAQIMVGWVLVYRPSSTALREGSAALLVTMLVASLALVDQTYHLGLGMSAFLFQMLLLILPMVLILDVSVAALVSLGLLNAWAILELPSIFGLLSYPILLLAILPHYLKALRGFPNGPRAIILSWALGLSFSIAYVTSLFFYAITLSYWIIVLLSALFALLHSLGRLRFFDDGASWQKPFAFLGSVGIIAMGYSFTCEWFWLVFDLDNKYFELRRVAFSGFDVPHVFVLVSVVAAILLSFVRPGSGVGLRDTLFGIVPGLAYGYVYLGEQGNWLVALIIANVWFFAASLALIREGLREGLLGRLNLGMLMLSGQFLARFLLTEMGMVPRGLAFIAVGVCFLVVNMRMMRSRRGK